MNFKRLILLISTLGLLSACGASKSAEQNSEQGLPTQEIPAEEFGTPGTGESDTLYGNLLNIGQNCDLSAYAGQPQNKHDFKFSTDPVLVVFKKFVVDFQLEAFDDLADQNQHIQSMLDSGTITIRTEIDPNPVCVISYENLRADVLKGNIPFDYLLNELCPAIAPADLTVDADTAKEQELLKLLEGYDQKLVEEAFLSHHLILADNTIDAAGYMGFSFNVAEDTNGVSFQPSANDIQYEKDNGFMATLNYTGVESSRCEYAKAP